jgi:hypothetical protein
LSVASSKISVKKMAIKRRTAAYPGALFFAYFLLCKQKKVSRHRRKPILKKANLI